MGHMIRAGGERRATKASVVQDPEVTRYYFVFQHGAGWDIDAISVVGDDDDGALD